MLVVIRMFPGTLILGTFAALVAFVLFYLMTVFTLAWGTGSLGYTREEFLLMQLAAVACFAVTIPVSAVVADRHGRRRTLIWVALAIAAFGFVFPPLFVQGRGGAMAALGLGLGLMGMTYGPLGTTLSELFPTAVRYTGSSLTFNLAGIFGASLAPYIATALAGRYGLWAVGVYLSGAAVLTLVALILTRETRDVDLTV
jgi:MFS family permease